MALRLQAQTLYHPQSTTHRGSRPMVVLCNIVGASLLVCMLCVSFAFCSGVFICWCFLPGRWSFVSGIVTTIVCELADAASWPPPCFLAFLVSYVHV